MTAAPHSLEVADLVIRNGRVVSDGAVIEAEVVVRGETIAAVTAPSFALPARTVVDARGGYVLPGAIDTHVHFNVFNSMVDDFESASVSAAFGGITTMMPFIGGREGMSLVEGLEHFVREGEQRSVVDFAMHCRLRPEGALIEQIPEAIACGVPSIKMFQAYKKRGMLFTDDQILRAMELTAAHGGLALLHCENGHVIDHLEDALRARGHTGPEFYLKSRPHFTEAEAISRAIAIADFAGCPLYVVHLSTAEGLSHIGRARARGQAVYAETCPQYLLLTDAEMMRQQGLAKIAPPLRWDRDREALWMGLAQGLVQTIGSDHAPFTVADKAGGARNIFEAGFGMPGIETMFPLVLGEALGAGRLSLPQLAAAASENAARIFGLYPRKGAIKVGADADLLIVDPAAEWTIEARHLHSRAGYTCFEGWRVKGRVTASFLRGRPLVRDGQLCLAPGSGRFLRRAPQDRTSLRMETR
jgi:dihydropyrimidinase